MPYVDKIENKGQIFNIQDSRIPEGKTEDAGKVLGYDDEGNLTTLEVSGASLDGESIVVGPIPEPEPVAEFDGVKYYHKCEFDLEHLAFDNSRYDLLTGELLSAPISAASMYSYMHGSYDNSLLCNSSYSYNIQLKPSIYESHAFTCVDADEDVTDDTKIYIPNCSAYYGYLSNDGKTFISYFNLKDDVPSKINSVKAGDLMLPIVDERIPNAKPSDIGKSMIVDENGSYILDKISETTYDATNVNTVQNLLTLIGIAYPPASYGEFKYVAKIENLSICNRNAYDNKYAITIKKGGSDSGVRIDFNETKTNIFHVKYSNVNLNVNSPDSQQSYIAVPNISSSASSSYIYNLTWMTGSIDWREAPSAGTQLYKHSFLCSADHDELVLNTDGTISISSDTVSVGVTLFTLDANAYAMTSSINGMTLISGYITGGFGSANFAGKQEPRTCFSNESTYNGRWTRNVYRLAGSVAITDTVTPL